MDTFKDLHFPLAGIDLSQGFTQQPNRPIGDGRYARTTMEGVNVRAFEPSSDRARGGSRPGLKRLIDSTISGEFLIQGFGPVVGVGYSAPGGGVQTSQSGRVVTLLAVSQGTVKVADAGATAWVAVTNGAAALITSGTIMSAVLNQKVYFADGTNYKFYNPATNAMAAWTATAGALPVDGNGNKPRLITMWRGRIVLSGILNDPQNWFMSAVDDATNFDYAPLSITPTQAVAGNNSTLGRIGDMVTGLAPFSDDVMLFGGDHTLWMMRGDPMAGGQIDRISDTIGMAWGEAWCKDPYGRIYFVSNRMGIYQIEPGSLPKRVSQSIEQLVKDVNTGTHTIRLIWSDRFQGLHVFITKTASAAAATHLFWESRTGAWWKDVFKNQNHNPLCCVTVDGNEPDDRVVVLGSWDGYVRFLDEAATRDDGSDIESSVMIGPLTTPDLDDVILKDIQAVMGDASGDVTFEVRVGETAEAAAKAAPILTGTWTKGRNFTNHVRQSGYAVFVRISSNSPWAMEVIRARVSALGKVRRRGR